MNKELTKEEIRIKWIRQTPLLSLDECVDNAMQEYADELEKKNESLRSSLSASERFRMQDAAEHLDDNLLLRKENKELKESYDILKYDSDVAIQQYWSSQNEIKELKDKVTELETVIAKLSQKILNESNY